MIVIHTWSTEPPHAVTGSVSAVGDRFPFLLFLTRAAVERPFASILSTDPSVETHYFMTSSGQRRGLEGEGN